MKTIDFNKENILYISGEQIDLEAFKSDDKTDYLKLRKKIEPWLTALFQSEHLSLLVGTGLSIALGGNANLMSKDLFSISDNNQMETNIKDKIDKRAKHEATELGRGEPNFEDFLRVALKLLEGYEILEDLGNSELLTSKLNNNIKEFIKSILENESSFNNNENTQKLRLLENFLLSFGSRTATRDRLHIFTTNYDRFIEYGLDEAGLLTLDRFIGKLRPAMHFHRMDLDYHYNPPGIRGEPRYVEGVVKLTKLHGSVDWKFENDRVIKIPLPFGSDINGYEKYFKDMLNSVVIFPNSSKAFETSFFPYSELFRDFSAAICRPNSVLVTYGYGFGDSHINRIILDMLTIPSTHLVIISYDKASNRISNFITKCSTEQLTLLIGSELADFEKLVTYYLPKPAIDRISERERRILEKRGVLEDQKSDKDTNLDKQGGF